MMPTTSDREKRKLPHEGTDSCFSHAASTTMEAIRRSHHPDRTNWEEENHHRLLAARLHCASSALRGNRDAAAPCSVGSHALSPRSLSRSERKSDSDSASITSSLISITSSHTEGRPKGK
uniref:Uncharacterized protein n=1 Tax=Aegilops tauschii subsp. strangulata TaxID=200361 RepID=A0A453NCA6_AEGTS